MDTHWAFLSSNERKNFKQAKKEEWWMLATEAELNQFTKNKVWTLVLPLVFHRHQIGI